MPLIELFQNFRDKYMRSALDKMEFPEFPPDLEKRYQIIFFFFFQGVGFRYEAWLIAQKLGLTGFAENLPNGDVRMEVQGPENKIISLKVLQAYAALHPSCPPTFAYDPRLYDCISELISTIISSVPACHLSCRPDKEAAEMADSMIFS